MARTVAERADALAMRWVFYYTRGLPAKVAYPRRDELESDLWEQRHEAREHGFSDVAIAASMARRVLTGMPADVTWRFVQLASADRSAAEHLGRRGAAAMSVTTASGAWIRSRTSTRKCKACGQRYGRELPNCPVCKIMPGYDGIPKKSYWPANIAS